MLQVIAVIKDTVDKIYILKDNRILIYKKNAQILYVMNKNTFKKEATLKLINKLDDLIILSNGNIAISINTSIFIYKIDKTDFKLIQEIKLAIEKRNLRSYYNYGKENIPDFLKAKCAEYKNGQYLLILKRIPFDDSKYGLYNCFSKIDIFSLKKDENYSLEKTINFSIEAQGRMLSDNMNNNLIIHGVQGTNPMSTRYSVYIFNLENQKERELNSMSYFNEKHKLFFISNNKILHYYTEFDKSFVYIYDIENNDKPISKTIENKDNYKIDYLYNNEKFIYFVSVKKKKEDQDDKLIFYKFNFNLDLIDEFKCSLGKKIGFNKVIKIKSNLLILFGINEMVLLRADNSSNDKKEKNIISEIFE